MAWYQITLTTDPNTPTPRECHSLCASGESLYMAGGNDSNLRYNEIFVLDTGKQCARVGL
jgi:hypothetical protein